MTNKFWDIWIDTGGTFTDCIARDPDSNVYYSKVLSKSALRGRIIERLDGSSFKIEMNWNTPGHVFKDFDFSLL